MENLNSVDLFILGIFVVSAVLGLMRGVVREVLSVFTWIAAFVVASLFSAKVAGIFSGFIQSSVTSGTGPDANNSIAMISLGISFVSLFVLTLLVGSVLNHLISSLAESGGISLANRLLGALFGLARGFLVVLVLIFLIGLTPIRFQPGFLQSQFVKSFDPIVKQLDQLIQPGLEKIKSSVGSVVNKAGDQYQQLKQNYRDTGASKMIEGQ